MPSEDYEKKYNELAKKINTAFKRIFIILGFLVVLGIVIGSLSIYLPTHLNNNRFNEIQKSRRNSVMTSCEEQNKRNTNTVLALESGLSKFSNKIEASKKSEVEESKQFTILLINALAPVEDCQARVKKLTEP